MRSTITLIPKVPGTEKPGDFRPISVGSIFLRLFHGIVGVRLERLFPISVRQKGFRKGDGIYLNSTLLQCCIDKSKSDLRNLRLAFVDMRKAFDSVGHDALWVACERVGVPPHLLQYFRTFYKYSSSQLILERGLSAPVTTRRGIKQGDPMSVHLFNAVIDMCMEALHKEIGFDLYEDGDGQGKLSYMAFDDDLVLFADSNGGLKVQTSALLGRLRECGFDLNAQKSESESRAW